MNIIHHFGLKIRSEAVAREFSGLGVRLDWKPGDTIASLKVSEDDPRWSDIRELAESHKITDLTTTRFSGDELSAASVLCILAAGHRSFPSNSDYLRFLEETYDLSNYCLRCGVGLEQVRPLRIKPLKDLNRTMWQLNWVFDEFLVTHDVWTSTFEPFGIGCQPVLSARSSSEISSIVQLQIPQQAPLESKAEVVCDHCGRKKAPLTLRGFAPTPALVPAPIFKSTNYFGSGASAFRRVFVSNSLYREIRKKSLRGLQFYPCVPTGQEARVEH